MKCQVLFSLKNTKNNQTVILLQLWLALEGLKCQSATVFNLYHSSGKFSRRQIDIFLFYPEMEGQSQFSGEAKKEYFKMSSTKILLSMLNIKG